MRFLLVCRAGLRKFHKLLKSALCFFNTVKLFFWIKTCQIFKREELFLKTKSIIFLFKYVSEKDLII